MGDGVVKDAGLYRIIRMLLPPMLPKSPLTRKIIQCTSLGPEGILFGEETQRNPMVISSRRSI